MQECVVMEAAEQCIGTDLCVWFIVIAGEGGLPLTSKGVFKEYASHGMEH